LLEVYMTSEYFFSSRVSYKASQHHILMCCMLLTTVFGYSEYRWTYKDLEEQRQSTKALNQRIEHLSTDEQQAKVCKICIEAESDAMFTGCGHIFYCMSCAEKDMMMRPTSGAKRGCQKCPSCSKVSFVQKMYFC
jgi:hypothetical protein